MTADDDVFLLRDGAPITVLHCPTDARPRLVRLVPTLTAMRALVGGGYLEAVIVHDRTAGLSWVAYCDDNGKDKGLPANEIATALAWLAGWQPFPGDRLVGPVAFCGTTGDCGEADVPPALLAIGARTLGLWDIWPRT